MKMPEKDPNVWLIIWAYIQQNYNAITGFVMAQTADKPIFPKSFDKMGLFFLLCRFSLAFPFR